MNFKVKLGEAEETWDRDTLVKHLERVVRNLPDWFGMKGATPETLKLAFDSINEDVIASDDLVLIDLFHRAVKHHNSELKLNCEPVLVYNKHYLAPAFSVSHTVLLVRIPSVHEASVRTTLSVTRNDAKATSLVLDCMLHTVNEVLVNGAAHAAFYSTRNELILDDVPMSDAFTVTVDSHMQPPSENLSCEGLYVAQNSTLCTQCESTGARRIFPCLDRPDVLSTYHVTIEASKEAFPVRLSNGNCVSETPELAVYDDPSPKPSYLFAVVVGEFVELKGEHFTRTEKRKVSLMVYAEPGKEQRAKFALYALKIAMQYEEDAFDREYPLNECRMVAVNQFASGAMENQSLIIFSADDMLVDSESGTDINYRRVAHVISHEFCHTWSGNRVTVRNWFELALKEGFTEMRSLLFMEWWFGDAIRINQVRDLRVGQFPEDAVASAHPIVVDSFYNPDSIYDGTTYTKGSEVFGMLVTLLNARNGPQGFRLAQNAYFSTYDGQAVTFDHLLEALQKQSGVDLSQFRLWFEQAGTPSVRATLDYDVTTKVARVHLEQSNPNPKTGEAQAPLHIPFSIELLLASGEVAVERHFVELVERKQTLTFENVASEPVPVFQHGFTAPIKMLYEYSDAELMTVVRSEQDAFAQWDAASTFVLRVLKKLYRERRADPSVDLQVPAAVLDTYREALESKSLSIFTKGNLLLVPSSRLIVQDEGEYDFHAAHAARTALSSALANSLEDTLLRLLEENPEPAVYDPMAPEFRINSHTRTLRNRLRALLLATRKQEHVSALIAQYETATNFNNQFRALSALSGIPEGEPAMQAFCDKWKGDTTMIKKWLQLRAGSKLATVATMTETAESGVYQKENGPHMYALVRAFSFNSPRFHDPKGEGYKWVADMMLEAGKTNDQVPARICNDAFQDYAFLPAAQKELMRKQLERIKAEGTPALASNAKSRLGN